MMVVTITVVAMMMAIADVHADAGNVNMNLRDGGRSEGECPCTGNTQNQISHFFSSPLVFLVLKRIASTLVHKFLAELAFMVRRTAL
jgi:hypothetical protein